MKLPLAWQDGADARVIIMAQPATLKVISTAAAALGVAILIFNWRSKYSPHGKRSTAAKPKVQGKTGKMPQHRRNQQGQLNPRFFAARDADGNLAINLRFLDTFLRWDCGRLLLAMGLFPNSQEITESMACVETIGEKLPDVRTASGDVVVVVIGDGRTPRTAALLAMRTKWQVISVDPALHGLEPPSADGTCDVCEAAPVEASYASLPKELRHPKLEQQERTENARRTRSRMRDELASIDRLLIVPLRAQEAAIVLTSSAQDSGDARARDGKADRAAQYPIAPIGLSSAGHVIIVLPHAHVTPDDALRCLRFDEAALAAQVKDSTRPTISVVQLPCCGYVFHDQALATSPDADFMDARIATSARCVRVWKNVSPNFDFEASTSGRGVKKQELRIAETKARRRAAQSQPSC